MDKEEHRGNEFLSKMSGDLHSYNIL